jgi:hypothetical protein
MGQAKAAMMEDEDNLGLVEFMEELIKRDELIDPAAGIAKQVIAKGVNSLSDKQKVVIEKVVDIYKRKNKCEICVDGNISCLSDYIYINENGLCPMCEYDREKFMRD